VHIFVWVSSTLVSPDLYNPSYIQASVYLKVYKRNAGNVWHHQARSKHLSCARLASYVLGISHQKQRACYVHIHKSGARVVAPACCSTRSNARVSSVYLLPPPQAGKHPTKCSSASGRKSGNTLQTIKPRLSITNAKQRYHV
jgi:hypothetical protein